MADNTEAQALQFIKQEVQRVKALTSLAEKLDSIGSLEKIRREKELAVAQLEKEASGSGGILASAHNEADKIVADAVKKATEIQDAANTRVSNADAMCAEAEAHGVKLIADAEAAVKKIEADWAKRFDSARTELGGLEMQSRAAAKDLANSRAAAQEAEGRRQSAEAEIARLKSLFK